MTAGTCQPIADVGQPCVGDPGSSNCASDAACDATTHTCRLQGQLGDPCPQNGCAQGDYCDSTSMTCKTKVPFGATCVPPTSGEDPCITGSCDSTTKACALSC
jgi:hypothetical protein